jgi:hypothetical protein
MFGCVKSWNAIPCACAVYCNHILNTVSNRLLMYCVYVHCSYCLAVVLCVALPAVLCVPPVSAGRAIRCIAGRHSSLSTPFLPTAGPLVGPARLSLATILLPLSNRYPWFYRVWALHLVTWDIFAVREHRVFSIGTPAVTFSRHWPVHRPAVIVEIFSLLTSPSTGLWSLSLDASPSIGKSSLWHLSLSPQDLSQAGGHILGRPLVE